MFGLEYVTNLIIIMWQLAAAIVTAIPFAFAWNRLAPLYLGAYIPEQFHHVPYWHMVGLILISMYVGEMIGRLSPLRLSMSQSDSK